MSDSTTIETSGSRGGNILFLIILIFILIWSIAGFIAFIMSIVCLSYEGGPTEKIAGLLLGLFAGPFYWLFYIYNINYCYSAKYYYPPQ